MWKDPVTHTQTKAAPLIPVIRRLEAHRSSGPRRAPPSPAPPPRLPGCGLPAPRPLPHSWRPDSFLPPRPPDDASSSTMPARLPLSPEPARSSAAQRLTAGPEAARPRSRLAPPPSPAAPQSGSRPRAGPAPCAAAPPKTRRRGSRPPRRPHAAGWPHAAGLSAGSPPSASRAAALSGELTRPKSARVSAAPGPAASACLPSCSFRGPRAPGRGGRLGLARSPPCAAVPAPTPRAGGAVTSRASACVAVGGRRPRSGAATSVWGGGSRGLAAAPAPPRFRLRDGSSGSSPRSRVQPRLLHPPPRPFSET